MICKATKNNPPPCKTQLHSDSAQGVKLDRSIRKQLLLGIRTTIGFGANHYSFRMQTTTRSACKPLLVRTRNNYWFECERLLLSLSPPTASRHFLGEGLLAYGCSDPKQRHVPTRNRGCGWGRLLSELTRASGAPAPGRSVG